MAALVTTNATNSFGYSGIFVQADGVTISGSVVGPNVSIGKGSVIEGSHLRDTVIGDKTRIARCTISNSLIGSEVVLAGITGEVTIGDHSEVRAER